MASKGRPPKVVKGGLSHEEKGRIIYLLKTLGSDSTENLQKIADDLGRNVESVKKAIIEMKEALGVDTTEHTKNKVKLSLIKRVLLNLIGAGFSKERAQAKINRVISNLSEEEQKSIDESTLYNLCMRNISAADLFVTSTAGGQTGIAINTQAASEVSDAKRQDFVDKKTKNPNIYKIFDDE